ncbi:MAG: sigma-70 family RNA polymerase sigma factor, partial [Christensenellales bacterium]
IEDIARAMEMPVEEVVFALEAIQDPVSLFEPVYHDGNDAVFVMDQMSDEKNKQENWLETIALSQALQRLAEREQNIIYLRYFKGRTQMEVAEEIGISQAQVSRLEKCALHRLKTQM